MPKSRHRKKPKKKQITRHGGGEWKVQRMRAVAQYPIRECLINPEWREGGMASILLSRNRPDGRIAFAAFAVDLGCLGVKSAFGNDGLSVSEYKERLLSKFPSTRSPCDPAFAVKMIQGAVAYAKELGFDPDPDYYYAREIFGDIDPTTCPDAIEYGKDGQPFYVAGPYDNIEKIMNQLNRKVGPGNFHYLIPVGPPDMFED